MNFWTACRRLLALLFLLGLCASAQAHKSSDSYLDAVRQPDGRVDWRWDIALRDLDVVLGLDSNGDRRLTWGEVLAHEDAIRTQALDALQWLHGGQPCAGPAWTAPLMIDSHSDGNYLVLSARTRCPADSAPALRYRFLQGIDANHRLIVQWRDGAAAPRVMLVTPDAHARELSAPADGSGWSDVIRFWREGVHHIRTGYDHLLFLLSLLLPVVLVRQSHGWRPGERWQPALREAVGLITAFTLAHSITLALSAFGLVRLPSRLVESLIAFSVILAALHNLRPVLGRGRWLAAFGFGLIHGFGFASALADLAMGEGGARLRALAGFNLGVESGQLAVVAVFLPLAWLLRRTALYPRWVLTGGSLAIAGVALIWMGQRVFNVVLIPG